MLTIQFLFTAGRFHATPWNRQVNEGVVEWPPHPWRILRGLLAVYYTKENNINNEKVLISLVEKMSEPPVYKLPPASIGHTRHYMPLYHDGKTSKVFDTFVALSKSDVLKVSWPNVELETDEETLLRSLLEKMSYLGRAESWVEASITEHPIKPNCMLLDSHRTDTDTMELDIIDVLVPMKEVEYLSWREEYLQKSDKKTIKDIMGLENKKDILCIETTKIKKDGWSQPPGSRWIQYQRPSNCFDVKQSYSHEKRNENKPTVARFAVASQVPPRLTDAVSVSERVHMSLVKYSDNSPVFTGHDENMEPLRGHKHAHVLCESNLALGSGSRGNITHISIYAPMGFGLNERKALDRLIKIWGHGGHEIQLVLISMGQPKDHGGIDTIAGKAPIFGKSKTWKSRTPYVPTRHPKSTRSGVPKMDGNGLQIGGTEHDLRRLLRENGFPEPVNVKPISSTNLAGHETPWLEFQRERKKGRGNKSTNMGFGFIITFAEAVQGPIALGYGSHFGLGLFIPVVEHDL